MTLLISTYDLLHQLEPSFVLDQYPAPEYGKKSIPVQSCNSPNGANPPFFISAASSWYFQEGNFIFPFYLCMSWCNMHLWHSGVPGLHFWFFCCAGALLALSSCKQSSLESSSQSIHVAQCAWMMMNIQIILKSVLAEARFNSRLQGGNTNFHPRSQRKVVSSL